ncbi:hypothetical protein N0V90_001591 [Kalmusia sp. IMI 367209]|nr:hypothetical protein N0V90_001591 [Kalmusia sp. IMI 367209]
MAPADHSSFSDLEVAPKNEPESWKYKIPDHSSEPIVLDPHALPEALPNQTHAMPSVGILGSHLGPASDETEVAPLRSRRRRLIILGVILGLVIIIGAVAGGILGSRHAKGASGNSIPTHEPTNNPDNPLGLESSQVLSTSKISAVNWTSGDEAGAHYRAVFWQAVTHDLMASIWESESNKWTIVNLTLGGTMDTTQAYDQQFIPPKIGTPLAATVRLSPWPRFNSIALFYLSEQNTVAQMNTAVITAKAGWKQCCLSNMPSKHTAAEKSQLAAFSVSCKGGQCKDEWIHVTYQMGGRKLALLTQQDWNNNNEFTYDDPQMGTGLTMTYTGSPSSSDNATFTPKLYLETPSEVQEKWWFPVSGYRKKIEASQTASDGIPLQLSSAVIPASGAAALNSNDLLLLSIASDGSKLLINQYSNQTGNWTGSSAPQWTGAPSDLNFTAGALVAAPDQPRFVGLESNGTIQSFKISEKTATQWEYEGVIVAN